MTTDQSWNMNAIYVFDEIKKVPTASNDQKSLILGHVITQYYVRNNQTVTLNGF